MAGNGAVSEIDEGWALGAGLAADYPGWMGHLAGQGCGVLA